MQQDLKTYWEKRRHGSLMLAKIRDGTWNVHNMQHIIPNLRRWNSSDIPGGSYQKLKDPPTWLKVAIILEKPPTPPNYNTQHIPCGVRVAAKSQRPSSSKGLCDDTLPLHCILEWLSAHGLHHRSSAPTVLMLNEGLIVVRRSKIKIHQ